MRHVLAIPMTTTDLGHMHRTTTLSHNAHHDRWIGQTPAHTLGNTKRARERPQSQHPHGIAADQNAAKRGNFGLAAALGVTLDELAGGTSDRVKLDGTWWAAWPTSEWAILTRELVWPWACRRSSACGMSWTRWSAEASNRWRLDARAGRSHLVPVLAQARLMRCEQVAAFRVPPGLPNQQDGIGVGDGNELLAERAARGNVVKLVRRAGNIRPVVGSCARPTS
jgi:hypothetical protein